MSTLTDYPTCPEVIEAIREGIAACDRYISRAILRPADIRPPEVVKLLAFYIDHRANLQSELDARLAAMAA